MVRRQEPRAEVGTPASLRWVYALLGLVLAGVAALGLAVLRTVVARKQLGLDDLLAQVSGDPLTFGYVYGAIAVLLVAPGYVLGRRLEFLWASAATDPLTCIPNRRYFETKLGQELDRAKIANIPLSLLRIDLDGLRGINERCGREAGDEALRLLSEVIRGTCRARDMAARYGDDDFAVLLPRTRADEALVLGDRIRTTLALRWMASAEHASTPPLTVSIGVADTGAGVAPDVETLLHAATRALGDAKAKGGDTAASAQRGKTAIGAALLAGNGVFAGPWWRHTLSSVGKVARLGGPTAEGKEKPEGRVSGERRDSAWD